MTLDEAIEIVGYILDNKIQFSLETDQAEYAEEITQAWKLINAKLKRTVI